LRGLAKQSVHRESTVRPNPSLQAHSGIRVGQQGLAAFRRLTRQRKFGTSLVVRVLVA
jgi:hypothetical protein